MHLAPHELDKLSLHRLRTSRRSVSRRPSMNYRKRSRFISAQVLEFLRDGRIGGRTDGSRSQSSVVPT